MIYLNSGNKHVRIAKPLQVSIPASPYVRGMQLYKGEKEKGELNWVDPQPLPDSMPGYVSQGRAIFMASCATCHALDRQLTGPALSGVEKRGPWTDRQNLFAWTRNPGAFIPLTQYTTCLTKTYNGQIMPSFPQLSDEELTAIFDYIKWGDTEESGPADLCQDSCRRYDSALLVVNKQKLKRSALVQDNGSMSKVFYADSSTGITANNGMASAPNLPAQDFVTMEDNRAEYYQFSINAFGWYNVDMLLKERDDLQESTLTATLQGTVEQHVDIYLIVPVIKLFTKAGRTNNPHEFAFYTKDGKLPLSQGVGAYILALSENETGVLFDLQEFTISRSQVIPLEVKPSTKEEVYRLFGTIRLKDVSVTVADAKNAADIRTIDKNVRRLQSDADDLKPRTCPCNCSPPASEAGDSTFQKPINVVPRP